MNCVDDEIEVTLIGIPAANKTVACLIQIRNERNMWKNKLTLHFDLK